MIKVQIFEPAHNVKGSAYGPHLASQLERWASWVRTHGVDGDKAYQKKNYIADEIGSMSSGLVSNMGSTSVHRPFYSIAILADGTIGAFCKRGNGSTKHKHKIELILSLPSGLRTEAWPSPSPTSILMGEAAHVALADNAALKLETENDDLVGLYNKVYGFEVSGDKYGERTPMKLEGDGLQALVNKYKKGTAWEYARALPAPPG